MNNNFIKSTKTMGYGIVKAEDLPKFEYKDKKLNYKDVSWATMSSFSEYAKNHCGPTFITNLCIFFESQGYKGLLIDGDIKKTFDYIHKITGNGPVFTTARTAKNYFASKGYKLKYNSIDSFTELKQAIDSNMPVSLLIAESLFSWHWVMGVGYLDSPSYDFVRIINAWEDTDERFYLVNKSSLFFSAKKFQIIKA